MHLHTRSCGIFAPFLLLLALTGTSAHPVDDKLKPFARTCPMLLNAVPIEDYIRAVEATELTPSALAAAEKKVFDSFAAFSWVQHNAANPRFQSVLRLVFSQFTGAVGGYIRGHTEVSEDWIRRISAALKEAKVTVPEADIRASVRGAASDPEIYRAFAMAEFILQKAPSVEALYAQLERAVPGLSELSFPGAAFLGPLIGGPRQAEMVRTALQYTTTTPEDHVLEIGYGTPAVLLGFAYYTRIKNLTGVDPFVLPDNANEVLKPAGIELLQGLFPDSPEVLERLKQKGPFSAVLALDVVKNLTVLDTTVRPEQFAKAIYDLLAEGGTAVLMNDFEEEPYFSEKQAEEAGFKVIRWGEIRELPAGLKAMMPYDPADHRAGRLKAFVIRKGQSRAGQIRAVVTRPGF
jgi:hypothetical protein